MTDLQRTYSIIDDEAYAAAILSRPIADYPLAPLREAVSGRRVLVTGAGGFIGAGLVRLIASLDPKRLVLVENGEYPLYAIDAELSRTHPELPRRALYCDVRDAAALACRFAEERPEIVFHAAALKQLPLLEDHLREAVLTNTLGARNVAEAAAAVGTLAVVLISTDKAVHCSSVLGATKRLAEAFFQAMDQEAGRTRFVGVRFGNVFGSTGSVVPLFRRQIEEGGPVTITDERMTRYFMTLSEAAGLVVSALSIALSDRSLGELYLLEVGPPLPIAELARRMILHSGANPSTIAIRTVGARPGERLSEQLVHDREQVRETGLSAVLGLSPRSWSLPIMRQQLAELERACQGGGDDRLWGLISRFAPDFPHSTERAGAVPASREA